MVNPPCPCPVSFAPEPRDAFQCLLDQLLFRSPAQTTWGNERLPRRPKWTRSIASCVDGILNVVVVFRTGCIFPTIVLSLTGSPVSRAITAYVAIVMVVVVWIFDSKEMPIRSMPRDPSR